MCGYRSLSWNHAGKFSNSVGFERPWNDCQILSLVMAPKYACLQTRAKIQTGVDMVTSDASDVAEVFYSQETSQRWCKWRDLYITLDSAVTWRPLHIFHAPVLDIVGQWTRYKIEECSVVGTTWYIVPLRQETLDVVPFLLTIYPF